MFHLGLFRTWLPQSVRREVKELYMATTMVNFALAMVMFWEPIYLYQMGYPLTKILLFYFITYLGYIVLMPIGAKFAKKQGYEASLLVGTCLYAFFYIALYLIKDYPVLFYVAAIIYTWQKTFYWPAYHANFARFSDAKEEGREVSAMTVATSLVYIIGPALAGLIIATLGYAVLFVVVSVIFFASNIPHLMTKEVFTPSSFRYLDVYKRLFSRQNRKSLIAYFGFGEEFVVLVIWPIFISIVVSNVLDTGLIVALATLVTTIITLYIGKLSDKSIKHRVLSLGSVFYSLAWFIRIFITNATGIFFLDTFSRLGKNTIAVPLTTITYERAKSLKSDQHHHIMSNIVFFEMSLALGKLLAIVLIYILLLFMGQGILAFNMTFVLAGMMTLLYMLL